MPFSQSYTATMLTPFDIPTPALSEIRLERPGFLLSRTKEISKLSHVREQHPHFSKANAVGLLSIED